MPNDDYSAFHALDPFFSIVMEGLSKYTDGEHYFDTLADDVLFEFRYLMAGWPEAIRGRADLYSGPAPPTIIGLSRSLLFRIARSCDGATTWILWRRGQR